MDPFVEPQFAHPVLLRKCRPGKNKQDGHQDHPDPGGPAGGTNTHNKFIAWSRLFIPVRKHQEK